MSEIIESKRRLASYIMTAAAALCIGAALSGCNTVEGAGQDIESAGQGIEDAAD